MNFKTSNLNKRLKLFSDKYELVKQQREIQLLIKKYELFTKDELYFELNRLKSKNGSLSNLIVVALILYLGAAYIVGIVWQGLGMLSLVMRQGPIKVPTHIVSISPFIYLEILLIICFIGPVILWLIGFKLLLNKRNMTIWGIEKLIESKY